MLLCLLALPPWQHGGAARSTAIAAVITTALLAYGLRSHVADSTTIPRYVQPLLLGGALAAPHDRTPFRRAGAWLPGPSASCS